jgi:hypothetical protein
MAITILIILAVLYATIALVFWFFQHLFFFRPEIYSVILNISIPFLLKNWILKWKTVVASMPFILKCLTRVA